MGNSGSFKPGSSGNPHGRPAKASAFALKIKEFAEKKMDADKSMTFDDAIMQWIVTTAASSKVFAERKFAIETYFNRRYGRVDINYQVIPNKNDPETKEIRVPDFGLKLG